MRYVHYMYVFIVLTAMLFMAAGSTRGQTSKTKPSVTCPPGYTFVSKTGKCVPTCPPGYTWTGDKCVIKK
jgi:hypothetical protein